jgi:NADH dehydrogenase
MKVFLTGGTGFVGSEVLRQLVSAGHSVRALVREGSEDKLVVTDGVEIHSGDITDATTMVGVLKDCDAVIHLVGIIREFPGRNVTFKNMHVKSTENVGR